MQAAPDIEVHTVGHDRGLTEVRRRFGRVDLPAAVAGLLAAIGSVALLAGLAWAVGYDVAQDDDLRTGDLVAGVAVVVVSSAIGGWVAGRMARYDGGRNGLVTALLLLVLAAVVVAVRHGDHPDRAPVVAAIAVAAALLAGFLGGRAGEHYHRRADETIVATRDGGIAVLR